MPQSLLKLKISRNSEIEFFESFIVYKGEKILCSDIDGIGYLYTRTQHRVYFVPVGTSHKYVIYIRARGAKYEISFSGEENKEMFGKLVNALDIVVKPFVVVNLRLDYIKNNRLEIGDLTITHEGLYKKRSWRDPAFLPWGKYYNSNINRGNAFVLEKDDSKKEYSVFFTRSMSSYNSVVLPDIINFIFAKNGVLDDTTRKQIIERKTQLTTASAEDAVEDLKRCEKCDAETGESQEFCAKCGYQLITKNSPAPTIEAAHENKPEIQEPAALRCSNCGNALNEDSKFCGNCGTPVPTS